MQEVGASRHNMDLSKRICFSPFCTNRSSLQQSAKRENDFAANYPSMANTIMVSTTITAHIASTKNSEALFRSKHRQAFLDKAGKLTTPGMECFRERLHAGGVSEDSAALITNARRSGTNAG